MERVFITFGVILMILIVVGIIVCSGMWLFEKTATARAQDPFLHGVMWTFISLIVLFLLVLGAHGLKEWGILDEEPEEESYQFLERYGDYRG